MNHNFLVIPFTGNMKYEPYGNGFHDNMLGMMLCIKIINWRKCRPCCQYMISIPYAECLGYYWVGRPYIKKHCNASVSRTVIQFPAKVYNNESNWLRVPQVYPLPKSHRFCTKWVGIKLLCNNCSMYRVSPRFT